MMRRTVIRRTLLRQRIIRAQDGTSARRVVKAARGAASSTYLTAAHRSFPKVDGELLVRGVSARVDVIRDRHGVPHVFASTDEDALFGQGLVHAQDRLFQMDGMRRLAGGRVA